MISTWAPPAAESGRRDHAFDGGDAHWKFISGSLPTNAIGSLFVDPRDPTGDTVYVGTGEGNASADSEASLGIYKTTDGGDTWSLVPGSDAFGDRAVNSMTLDKDGNLLVGITSAIRGVTSVSSGGAIGCNTPTHNPCAIRGLYRQTGATFTRIFTSSINPFGCDPLIVVGCIATRGVTKVALDPNDPNTIYVGVVPGGRLALARQRRDMDADQADVERDPEHRSLRVRGQRAPGRQDADVRRGSATRRRRRQPRALLAHG